MSLVGQRRYPRRLWTRCPRCSWVPAPWTWNRCAAPVLPLVRWRWSRTRWRWVRAAGTPVASSCEGSGTSTDHATGRSPLLRPQPSYTPSASTWTATGTWTPPQQRHRRRRRSSYPAARHRITAAFTHTAIGCYTSLNPRETKIIDSYRQKCVTDYILYYCWQNYVDKKQCLTI